MPCCGTVLHDATAGFKPPPDTAWQPGPFRADFGAPGTVISRCDAGPWNLLARDGRPFALIDWDTAGPTGRLDEVVATAWWNTQLHDDDIAARNSLPPATERAAQLRHFLDDYRLAAAERNGLITRMIEYAIRDRAAEAVQAQVTPDSADPAPLWALAWRARSAAWMIRHRALLEKAIRPERR